MRVAVVTFPGSNCDQDVVEAVRLVGSEADLVWHRDTELGDADAVVLPGGFSYGDYLRAGAIARMSPILPAVTRFAAAGGPVLGICNGFQILCEAGLLPGALIRNDTLAFESRDVFVRVERTDTAFTSAYQPGARLRIPIAHAEGRYYADPEAIAELEGEGRVVFRYVDAANQATEEANPNGSVNSIAGIRSARGNVLGLMPHPERAMERRLGSDDGVGIFTSLQASLALR
jgi:phosphoribosylformylglycinamidine synthase